MNEDKTEAAKTIHQLAETGRARLAHGSRGARDLVDAATDYVRANPWIAVAGAAVFGGIVSAMSQPRQIKRQSSRASVRDWLRDSHASLPTGKQFRSVAKSAGIPTTFEQLKARLREI